MAPNPRRQARRGNSSSWNAGASLTLSSNTNALAAAAVAGRSLLDRPKNELLLLDDNDMLSPPVSKLEAMSLLDDDNNTLFTANAATSSIRRVSTDLSLKSCMSSSSFNNGGYNPRRRRRRSSRLSSSGGSNQNEEFNLSLNSCDGNTKLLSLNSGPVEQEEEEEDQEEVEFNPRVSFSNVSVREYEITLGDNPSVSSGAPLSLGWKYNPHEKVTNLDSNETTETNNTLRRSGNELLLSDEQRRSLLSSNSSISVDDINEVLESVERTKMERQMSFDEVRREMVVKERIRVSRRGG